MPASVLTCSGGHLTFVYWHPFPFLWKIASRFHFAYGPFDLGEWTCDTGWIGEWTCDTGWTSQNIPSP